MHERTNIRLSAADRSELEAVAANRNSPQKHVWRAKIVLLTADGHGTADIMRATGKAKTVIWRWQERFGKEGVAGLARDKTRPSRIPPGTRWPNASSPAHWRPAGRDDTGRPPPWPKNRHQHQFSAAHLAQAWPAAASDAPVQAVQCHSSPPSCTRSSGSMSTRRPHRRAVDR